MQKLLVLFFIFCFLIMQQPLIGQCDKGQYLSKQLNSSTYLKKFNINSISTFILNNGTSDVDGFNSGFEFPKGSNCFAVYSSGLLFGCKTSDSIAVCGSFYMSSFKPGGLDNETEPFIYRIRPDFKTCTFQEEMDDESKSYEELYSEYEQDWNFWPVEKGAPFQDLNNNGVYEPTVDIPGVPGADQTLWFVMNAADPNYSHQAFLSPAVDVEIQVTVWGYKSTGYLMNVLFKKVKIINKGDEDLTDMFLSCFMDPDIGGAHDDFIGCDTTLNLAFAYNSDPVDNQYSTNPPAVGICYLKTANDNKNNSRKMTSFANWRCGVQGEIYCPDLDAYETGALVMYNLMQGKVMNGQYMSIPEELGGGSTRYRVPGDPVAGIGWVDGMYDSEGDRYFLMSTGPFNLASGEEEEIILAQFAAGGVPGITHLQAVTELKNMAQQLQDEFGMIIHLESSGEIPAEFELMQNYPNPFNPSTKIKYSISSPSNVEIKIYDLLGRKITELENDYKVPGTYEVDFDASHFPSGVYFYELRTENFSQQRKMVLIK